MPCVQCSEPVTERFRLYDRKNQACGDHCSRECAEANAWGPRFRPYKVRKLPALKRAA